MYYEIQIEALREYSTIWTPGISSERIRMYTNLKQNITFDEYYAIWKWDECCEKEV